MNEISPQSALVKKDKHNYFVNVIANPTG